MEPKDKAIELIDKFEDFVDYQEDDCFTQREKILINAKKCALIAVDEILKSKKQNIIHFYRCGDEFCECAGYWYEVKQEIEKL
jgi:hypothetical protein